MAKEWTDEEVQEEIRNAVRIVHEDRERQTYLELHGKYGEKKEGEEGGPKPPPKKDKTEEPPKKKKSIWWAESDEGE